MRARLLIVDDDPFTQTVLVSTVQMLSFDIVGTAGTAPEAMHIAATTRPDIALVDLDLGAGPTGIDVARALRKPLPDIALVMLSTYAHPRLIGHNQAPLPVGTIYVVKSSVTGAHVLADALTQALDWKAVQARTRPEQPEPTASLAALTDLQVDLLRQCAAGYSNAEIARRRSITEASVEKSVHRLMRDLGIQPSKDHNPRVVLAQIYFKATGTVSERRS